MSNPHLMTNSELLEELLKMADSLTPEQKAEGRKALLAWAEKVENSTPKRFPKGRN